MFVIRTVLFFLILLHMIPSYLSFNFFTSVVSFICRHFLSASFLSSSDFTHPWLQPKELKPLSIIKSWAFAKRLAKPLGTFVLKEARSFTYEWLTKQSKNKHSNSWSTEIFCSTKFNKTFSPYILWIQHGWVYLHLPRESLGCQEGFSSLWRPKLCSSS